MTYRYHDLDEACRATRNLLHHATWAAWIHRFDEPQHENITAIALLHGHLRVQPSDSRPETLMLIDDRTGASIGLDMYALAISPDTIAASAYILIDLSKYSKFISAYPIKAERQP